MQNPPYKYTIICKNAPSSPNLVSTASAAGSLKTHCPQNLISEHNEPVKKLQEEEVLKTQKT
jgi:hypothetical protein